MGSWAVWILLAVYGNEKGSTNGGQNIRETFPKGKLPHAKGERAIREQENREHRI